MEPISDVKWDVVLGGTGLAESLLALSLSRSDKKILHVDRNGYYGGAEAALSLQDAEEWKQLVQDGHARITKNESINGDETKNKLGFSRSYSLALAPQIVYCKSDLIQKLVASKVYRQLDFLAVGSWWIYEPPSSISEDGEASPGRLRKIPNRREDIFEDSSLDMKSKRALIKFLRLIMDAEAQATVLSKSGDRDLQSFLTEQFHIQPQLQIGLHALTLSPWPAKRTPLSFALPRITRHLSSFGMFGPGFGAVIPKWGGLAEVAQVACRALAVGGGVYMLGTGIMAQNSAGADCSNDTAVLQLQNGDTVSTSCMASVSSTLSEVERGTSTRSIAIVASELHRVFPALGEGAPKPAAAVVTFSSATLDPSIAEDLPVYLIVHSSDTGECPSGQSVVYASVGLDGEPAAALLTQAISRLLTSVEESPETSILWTMTYRQSGLEPGGQGGFQNEKTDAVADDTNSMSIELPPPSLDHAFDDAVLQSVKAAWANITRGDASFMEFEDREVGAYDSDEED